MTNNNCDRCCYSTPFGDCEAWWFDHKCNPAESNGFYVSYFLNDETGNAEKNKELLDDAVKCINATNVDFFLAITAGFGMTKEDYAKKEFIDYIANAIKEYEMKHVLGEKNEQ